MRIMIMLPLFFLAVHAATPVASDNTPPTNALLPPKTSPPSNALLSSNTLLPYDAMLPLHTPVISDRLTIWGRPYQEIAPREYEIYLQPDYTLQEHFATIGKQFQSPHIHHVGDHFADPDIFDQDRYMLRDAEEADVDLIRRDPRVEYVGLVAIHRPIDNVVEPPAELWAAFEARREGEALEQESIYKEANRRDKLPYDAMLPLHTPALSDKLTIWGEPFMSIEPGEFEIYLQPGYTLEEHFETIGKRFERPQICCIGDHIADPDMFDQTYYRLRNTDMADVDLIRRDPRVQWVGLAAYGRGIDDAVEPVRWAAYEARLEQEHLERERIETEANQRDELR